MTKENNLAPANSFYRVAESFDALAVIGCADSETFVGRTRALKNVYLGVTLQPGDQIQNLHGGLFLVRDGAASVPVALRADGVSPLIKDYRPPREVWPLDRLEPLTQAERLPLADHNSHLSRRMTPEEIAAAGAFAHW